MYCSVIQSMFVAIHWYKYAHTYMYIYRKWVDIVMILFHTVYTIKLPQVVPFLTAGHILCTHTNSGDNVRDKDIVGTCYHLMHTDSSQTADPWGTGAQKITGADHDMGAQEAYYYQLRLIQP